MNMRFWVAALGLVLAVGAAGCRKKTTDITDIGPPRRGTTPTTISVVNFTSPRLLLQGRGTYGDGERSLDFNYRLHLEQGQRIWFSVSVLGIEGARMLATPTQLQVLDRLNKRYYTNGYDLVRQKLGLKLTYTQLEDLVLGNLSPGMAQPLEITPRQSASYEHRQAGVLLRYFIDAANQRVMRVLGQDSSTGMNAQIDYATFSAINAQPLAQTLKVQVQGASRAQLLLEHKKAEANPPDLSFNFQVPSGYERVD